MKSKDSTSPKLRYFVRSNSGEIYDGPFDSEQQRDVCVELYRSTYGGEPAITMETIKCQTATYAGRKSRRSA